MEDTLFSFILFVGFYCLYSKMFAPKTTVAAVTAPAAVPAAVKVEPVKAVEPLTADRTTTTGAASQAKSEPQTVTQQTAAVAHQTSVQQTATETEVAPDRDRDFLTIADCTQPTPGDDRQTPLQTVNSRSKQSGTGKPGKTAIAQRKAS